MPKSDSNLGPQTSWAKASIRLFGSKWVKQLLIELSSARLESYSSLARFKGWWTAHLLLYVKVCKAQAIKKVIQVITGHDNDELLHVGQAIIHSQAHWSRSWRFSGLAHLTNEAQFELKLSLFRFTNEHEQALAEPQLLKNSLVHLQNVTFQVEINNKVHRQGY